MAPNGLFVRLFTGLPLGAVSGEGWWTFGDKVIREGRCFCAVERARVVIHEDLLMRRNAVASQKGHNKLGMAAVVCREGCRAVFLQSEHEGGLGRGKKGQAGRCKTLFL